MIFLRHFFYNICRHLRRNLKDIAAIISMVAVLMHAFVPVAAHALMAKAGKSVIEICTAKGFATVEIDESGKSTPGVKIDHQCALCSLASAPAILLCSSYIDFLPSEHGNLIAFPTSPFVLASVLLRNHPPTGPPVL